MKPNHSNYFKATVCKCLPPIEYQEDSAVFLSRNENVKKFGSFDADGAFFEINTIKD